jgi:alpha-amylase
MTNVCMYFQVHQPWRIGSYKIFDIGKNSNYWDNKKNEEVMHKVARKCYRPTNNALLSLLHKHDDFKCSFSITGTAMDQFEQYAPDVLDTFQKLVDTGKVEILSETYCHSLSFLHNKEEFRDQVAKHYRAVKKHFGVKPTVFRNTELIFNNELAHELQEMGYKAVLAEGVDRILGWRSPNFVYTAKTAPKIKLLLKNYRLSDDIAFRFGDKNWSEYPVTASKFASWVAPVMGDTVNLFMDYETFGEHQWADTGIFNFIRHMPGELKKKGISFQTPSEAAKHEPKDELDIHAPISWADVERDTSAWLGNRMQTSAAEQLYALRSEVLASGDEKLIDDWRKLTTSDHFYYMCVKWFADGDVHKYFNPYDSPYDAFINFMNVLRDVHVRATGKEPDSQGWSGAISKWIQA